MPCYLHINLLFRTVVGADLFFRECVQFASQRSAQTGAAIVDLHSAVFSQLLWQWLQMHGDDARRSCRRFVTLDR
jgi:hypothetical protein